MALELPIEEYFKYHPPTTPERIALHERVNQESLEICNEFINANINFRAEIVEDIHDRAMTLCVEVCEDETVGQWATHSLEDAKRMALRSNLVAGLREESILMYIQQFRMFLNQGITVDELKRQQLAEGMAKVTTEDIAEIFRMHGEAVPVSNDPDKFNISPQQFVERTLAIQKEIDRRFNNIIHLSLDGDKWCALIGENLQVGIAGFGEDPIAALSDLYANFMGMEFAEVKNSSGKVYATVFKSVKPVSEIVNLHKAFINAYGQALFNRNGEEFDRREALIAEWVGDNWPECEQIGGGL